MSLNYYYNSKRLDSVISYKRNNATFTGYTNLDFNFVSDRDAVFNNDNSFNEQPANTGYQINGTDIATKCFPYYTENTASGSNIIPSWCNKISAILIGKGGTSGIYTTTTKPSSTGYIVDRVKFHMIQHYYDVYTQQSGDQCKDATILWNEVNVQKQTPTLNQLYIKYTIDSQHAVINLNLDVTTNWYYNAINAGSERQYTINTKPSTSTNTFTSPYGPETFQYNYAKSSDSYISFIEGHVNIIGLTASVAGGGGGGGGLSYLPKTVVTQGQNITVNIDNANTKLQYQQYSLFASCGNNANGNTGGSGGGGSTGTQNYTGQSGQSNQGGSGGGSGIYVSGSPFINTTTTRITSYGTGGTGNNVGGSGGYCRIYYFTG